MTRIDRMRGQRLPDPTKHRYARIRTGIRHSGATRSPLSAEELLALLACGGERNVAQLMVRNVDEAVVRELKQRAARRNHSAEQEHREILEHASLRPKRRSLAEATGSRGRFSEPRP